MSTSEPRQVGELSESPGPGLRQTNAKPPVWTSQDRGRHAVHTSASAGVNETTAGAASNGAGRARGSRQRNGRYCNVVRPCPTPATCSSRLSDPRQFDLAPTGGGQILDIGCGAAKVPGAVGLDISADTAADIVHDLDSFPYPIADSSFDQILLQDVIEHVSEPIRVFEELHRIARPGARVQLRTPHFSSVLAYGDPTPIAITSRRLRSVRSPSRGLPTTPRSAFASFT